MHVTEFNTCQVGGKRVQGVGASTSDGYMLSGF